MAAVLRRHAAAAALAACLLAACGSNDAPDPGIGAGATTVPGDTTTPGATGAGDATATTGRTGTTRATSGANAAPGTTNLTRADDDDLTDAATSAPGQFAGMLLAPSPATSLVVEVLVQKGAEADPATLTVVRDLLATNSGKNVTLRGPVALSSSDTVHSADEIRSLAQSQGRKQGDGAGVIHLLYLDGQYSDDSALGVAVRGDTVAVFPDQLDRVASPFVSRSRVERAVATHELGHLLGLVDTYLDTGRDDPEHPGHSTNPQSVMYWAVESDLVGQVLGGPPPTDFDARDRADLQKIRGGARPD